MPIDRGAGGTARHGPGAAQHGTGTPGDARHPDTGSGQGVKAGARPRGVLPAPAGPAWGERGAPGVLPGDAAQSPCPCEPLGRGQPGTAPHPNSRATPSPSPVLPPAEGSGWDISLALSPRKFWSWLCPSLHGQLRAVVPTTGYKELHDGAAALGHGRARADPHASRIPGSSEHLPFSEPERALLRLLLRGCCTGDGAQSFLPGSRKSFFNTGKQSGLAVLMRGEQRSPALRSQPPAGMDGCVPALYLSQPPPRFQGQGPVLGVRRQQQQQHLLCLGLGDTPGSCAAGWLEQGELLFPRVLLINGRRS